MENLYDPTPPPTPDAIDSRTMLHEIPGIQEICAIPKTSETQEITTTIEGHTLHRHLLLTPTRRPAEADPRRCSILHDVKRLQCTATARYLPCYDTRTPVFVLCFP